MWLYPSSGIGKRKTFTKNNFKIVSIHILNIQFISKITQNCKGVWFNSGNTAAEYSKVSWLLKYGQNQGIGSNTTEVNNKFLLFIDLKFWIFLNVFFFWRLWIGWRVKCVPIIAQRNIVLIRALICKKVIQILVGENDVFCFCLVVWKELIFNLFFVKF